MQAHSPTKKVTPVFGHLAMQWWANFDHTKTYISRLREMYIQMCTWYISDIVIFCPKSQFVEFILKGIFSKWSGHLNVYITKPRVGKEPFLWYLLGYGTGLEPNLSDFLSILQTCATEKKEQKYKCCSGELHRVLPLIKGNINYQEIDVKSK